MGENSRVQGVPAVIIRWFTGATVPGQRPLGLKVKPPTDTKGALCATWTKGYFTEGSKMLLAEVTGAGFRMNKMTMWWFVCCFQTDIYVQNHPRQHVSSLRGLQENRGSFNLGQFDPTADKDNRCLKQKGEVRSLGVSFVLIHDKCSLKDLSDSFYLIINQWKLWKEQRKQFYLSLRNACQCGSRQIQFSFILQKLQQLVCSGDLKFQ